MDHGKEKKTGFRSSFHVIHVSPLKSSDSRHDTRHDPPSVPRQNHSPETSGAAACVHCTRPIKPRSREQGGHRGRIGMPIRTSPLGNSSATLFPHGGAAWSPARGHLPGKDFLRPSSPPGSCSRSRAGASAEPDRQWDSCNEGLPGHR